MSAVYPLASVADLRKEEEEAKKKGLAQAIEAHAQAADATRRAEDAASAHRSETEAVRRDEEARDGGLRTVASALVAQAWLSRRKTEQAALLVKLEGCRRQEATLLGAIDTARAALAQARAEVEALAKHRQKWDAENARTQERREEAEQEDRRLLDP